MEPVFTWLRALFSGMLAEDVHLYQGKQRKGGGGTALMKAKRLTLNTVQNRCVHLLT